MKKKLIKLLCCLIPIKNWRKQIRKLYKNSNKNIELNNKPDFSHEQALERISKRGLEITTFIDIGASDGRWSQNTMLFFPHSNYFLIDPNENHENGLKKFCEKHTKAQYISAAAGGKDGETYFQIDPQDDFGGAAIEGSQLNKENKNLKNIICPVWKLDTCAEKFNLTAPYAIKFDTHGFELPILDGAKEMLKQTSLIIMECYNFDIAPNSLKFYDMCKHMEKTGFRPIDIAEPLWRHHDESLWQMDIYFIPIKSKEFEYNGY